MNCGATQPHSFFDPSNAEATAARNRIASIGLDDMLKYFTEDKGCVAVYDATNSSRVRRLHIHDECTKRGISVMFIESICDDPNLVLNNVRQVKVSSPDYAGVDPELAAEDFLQRIKHYESAYETIGNEELHTTFVKLINVGSQIVINRINGYLQSRIVYYLMNLHINPQPIYLSRHGESQFNLTGKIGGDSDLSERGELFAHELPRLMSSITENVEELIIWTSTLRRTAQTALYFPNTKVAWKALDELDSGVCDGMTYEEIEKRFPDDFRDRDNDKYSYRYKGGESYRDLVNRLEPVIMELERHNEPKSIYIIGHQAVLRAIYAYYMNFAQDELPYINIPLHTVIKLTPRAYGCAEERFSLDIPAVDTHRPKPAGAQSPTALSPDVSLAGIAISHYNSDLAKSSNLLKLKSRFPQPASPLLVPAYPPTSGTCTNAVSISKKVHLAPTASSTLAKVVYSANLSSASSPEAEAKPVKEPTPTSEDTPMSPCNLDSPGSH